MRVEVGGEKEEHKSQEESVGVVEMREVILVRVKGKVERVG